MEDDASETRAIGSVSYGTWFSIGGRVGLTIESTQMVAQRERGGSLPQNHRVGVPAQANVEDGCPRHI
jgi:hypothetical protein